MNHDPSRDNPDEALTAPADTDNVPSFEVFESIAVEAVTATASSGRSGGRRIRCVPCPDRRLRGAFPLGLGVHRVGRARPDGRARIGPYELTARIGGGSMGTVYRATRVEDFRQEVAIKLIRCGTDGEAIVRRFQAKVHAQAALGKHSSIAGLLDAATTEDGRPYFVREYVNGQPIDAYCDGRRLDVPARLRLLREGLSRRAFRPPARRDPRRTEAGRDPGDLGWGTQADRLRHRQADPSRAGLELGVRQPRAGHGGADHDGQRRLRAGGRALQAPDGPRALPARRRGDIGDLPGHLRAGTRAAQRGGLATAGLGGGHPRADAAGGGIRAGTSCLARAAAGPTPEEIAEARGVTPVRLERMLAGDLDAIALMALRKEPESRYASAEQFADDVHRFLVGRPVRAHRDSPGYRAAKFVRRHASAVAVGIVLLLSMVAGIAGTTTGLVLVRRERDRAEASSQQARRAVNQFFTRVTEDRQLNQPGLQPLRKVLLRDSQRFYEEFLDQHGDDPALRAELAAARSRAARITGEIGSPAQAVRRLQQAVALWEKLVAAQPGNPDDSEGLARTLNDLGLMLMRLQGRRDEALVAFRRAEGLLEPLVAADPTSGSRRHDLSLALQNIGQIRLEQGQPSEAIEASGRSWRSSRNGPPGTPRPSNRGSPWPRPRACWARP